MDAWGNVAVSINGAGDLTARVYDELTGRAESVTTSDAQDALQFDAEYRFDALGNLLARASVGADRTGSEELFDYDAMNRLVTARKRELDEVNLDMWALPTPDGDWDQQTESRYDGQYSAGDDPDTVAPGAGNLTHKGGASQYYGANDQCDTTTGPHAVCATGPEGGEATVQYTYDANGNQIQRQTNDTVDRSIDYTVFNKAWRVSSGQGTTKFWYDAERRRFKREDVGERFVFYIGNTEVIRQNGTTTYRRQVAGAMVVERHGKLPLRRHPDLRTSG